MRKFLLPLNLQLFADALTLPNGEKVEIDPSEIETDDELGDIDIEDEDEETTSDGGDESEEAEQGGDEDGKREGEHGEDERQEEQQEEVTKKEPNDAAKAAIAERKKWQEKLDKANQEAKKSTDIANKLMKLAGVSSMDELQAKLDAAEAMSIAKAQNITPEQAQAQLREQREKDELKREIRRLKYTDEVRELKKDPFFADIEDHRVEFEEIADRTGMTLEEVYMSKRGKARMKEMEREIEQRVAANANKRQKAKVDTTADGTQTKAPKVDLAPDLLSAAKLAVSLGHFKSVEEYAQYHKKYGKK